MVGQVGIAGRKLSVGDGKVAGVAGPKLASAAELLIDAKTVTGGLGDISRAAFYVMG